MLKDEEMFYQKYIEKSVPRQTMSAFDVGSYFHAKVLEPHTIERDFATYTGKVRRGKDWEDFKAKHEGKIVLTENEVKSADELVSAVQASPIAMSLLEKCQPEVSAFLPVFVYDGEIYAVRETNVYLLDVVSGWIPEDEITVDNLEEFGTSIIIKVRADALSSVDEHGCGFIADLKSTSGEVKDDYEIASKVAGFDYDLSASLYLDVFSFVTNAKYEKFYWIWASKETKTSRTTYASDKYVRIGRAKWRKAVLKCAHFMENNWTFTDTLGVTEPPAYLADMWATI